MQILIDLKTKENLFEECYDKTNIYDTFIN